mgnify:CR=1 FL=1
MTTTKPTSLLALLCHKPPLAPFAVLALAGGVAQLPAPSNPGSGGISPSVLVLPLIGIAALATMPHLLRAMSQRRALRSGPALVARVTTVEDLTTTPGLWRARFSWTDPKGRSGRSQTLKQRWCPAKGMAVRVLEDPAQGRQWWEGDLPCFPPESPSSGPPGPPLCARRSDLIWSPTFVLAVFLALFAILLLISDAPLWLAALPGLAAATAFHRARRGFAARDRALCQGRQITAKVVGHRRQSLGASGGGASVALEWQSKEGHFGTSSSIAALDAPKVGSSILIRIDPITRSAVWIGDGQKEDDGQIPEDGRVAVYPAPENSHP